MSAARGASTTAAAQTLRVQAVFYELDPHKAEHIAAEMVARAHELANTPECECDVDVNIESLPPSDALSPSDASPRSSGAESPADTARPSATGATASSAR